MARTPAPEVPRPPDPTPEASPFASMGEVSDGGAFTPSTDMGAKNAIPVTKVAPAAPFMLMFDPRAWIVMGGRVVPRLKRLAMIPGVGGVDQTEADHLGRRSVKSSAARAMREEIGERPIPFEAVPPKHRVSAYHQNPAGPYSYLWKPKGRPDVNLLIYERCYAGSERLDCDEAGYLEFIDHLMALGIVTPPPAWALRDMLEKVRVRADKAAQDAVTNRTMVGRAEALARQVETIERELVGRDDLRPSSGDAAPPDIGG